VDERPPLELLEVTGRLVAHLPVQDLDGVEPHLGGEVDALLQVLQVAVAELPERVRRDADAGRARRLRLVGAGEPRACARGGSGDDGGGRGEELAAVGCHDGAPG